MRNPPLVYLWAGEECKERLVIVVLALIIGDVSAEMRFRTVTTRTIKQAISVAGQIVNTAEFIVV